MPAASGRHSDLVSQARSEIATALDCTDYFGQSRRMDRGRFFDVSITVCGKTLIGTLVIR
jgi:hypothetical protein